MKSKVKYTVLVLVIGLLGLAILASPVFGGGPKTELYTVEIIGEVIYSDVFTTEGNKPGTRFNPFPKGDELPVTVTLTFVLESLFPVGGDFDNFRTSPLLEGGLQDLNEIYWEFHHIKISGNNSLYCRFDLFYPYDGAWDHYVLDIYMEFTKDGNEYESIGDATINWTHYTENTKPRGKKPKIEFQQLEHTSYGLLTITITEVP